MQQADLGSVADKGKRDPIPRSPPNPDSSIGSYFGLLSGTVSEGSLWLLKYMSERLEKHWVCYLWVIFIVWVIDDSFPISLSASSKFSTMKSITCVIKTHTKTH